MDLMINFHNKILNIRTAVLIETDKGYIFEKHPHEYFYCAVGGRVQINESSENAAKREIKEELGLNIEKLNLQAIVENFFLMDDMEYHEICFYYRHKIYENIELPENFHFIKNEEVKNHRILPIVIHKMIGSKKAEILHFVTGCNTAFAVCGKI